MPSTTEIDTTGEASFVQSIKGKITLANSLSVLVLLLVAAFATLQFRELGKLLGSISDGAEVLMRLEHAYDEREALLTAFRKGYGDGASSSAPARARFVAIAEDVERHSRAARQKLAGSSSAPCAPSSSSPYACFGSRPPSAACSRSGSACFFVPECPGRSKNSVRRLRRSRADRRRSWP